MPTAARIPTSARIRARRRRVRTAGLVASAALVAAGLAGCAPVTDLRGNWHLVSGSDARGDLPVGDVLVTMRVEGDAVQGRGPCNDYSGPWSDQGPGMLSAVTTGGLPCDDDGLEARYFGDLQRVSSLRVDDGHLVATGPDDVRLEYAERSRG